MKNLILFTLFSSACALFSCSGDDSEATTSQDNEVDYSVVIDASSDNFTGVTVNIVPCTLSNGTETNCYEIVTTSAPTDHEMGPWCPSNISDDDSAGGIWLDSGTVYDVDGEFVSNLATFYNDNTWLMYDDNGDIYITETEEDCINAANPNVGEEYENFCVECIPSYITDLTQTWTIPITPIALTTTYSFNTAPGATTGPSTRGVALNGIEFSAPAPVSNILAAYTLAPFDDAGGHINVNQGYHYHAATQDIADRHVITQTDGHAELIGYAMDGHGIYARVDEIGNEPTDLDECKGHYDDIRGYHYHVDNAGNNNFIDCLKGAYVL
ncbi:YHYH protein [Neotamlana laminarinivorans]|uniref:YHYH protein n=1 Tax=Neotamlana laminarinivorans TaxID=2883124 RepID=A0A9X1L3Y5_9FLAO|nr:YHYH protein [Tamlana laminarinivorans]MCB4797756.1 YHYH protein [Tamlana laminarinivorans]